MENYSVENINNDALSQSYFQSIESVTGVKDNIFNFKLPTKLLKVRETAWDNLFGKYSKEMSDDMEINVETLEPDEEEIEKKVCEEEHYHEQRSRMGKSATLVQYWINTGNQPYKVLLEENELSDTGVSLSEKEVTLSLHSSISNVINEGNKQEFKSESSYSSINTAAYILSNANVTNKADTIAIIENAKCGKHINSSRNISVKDIKVTFDNKIRCTENSKIDCVTHNNNSNVNNVPDTEFYLMPKKDVASELYNQPTTNIVTSGNTIESNIYSQSNEKIDETNIINTNQRSLDIENRDNFVQQFDKTLKRLTEDGINNEVLNQDKILAKDASHEEGMSQNIAQKIITTDISPILYRKKLYTGRNSPIDLIQTEKHSISRLSEAKQSLHPALDPDSAIEGETLLRHKRKNLAHFSKRNFRFNKINRKRSFVSDKNIDINNESPNNNLIQNYISNTSFETSLDNNYLDKQNDILLPKCNKTDIFVRNEAYKQNLAHLNINPVVLLERIAPFFKQHESKSTGNNHITEESNVNNCGHLSDSNKLYTQIENVELETTIDSDDSTILVCKCKTNIEYSASISKENDCSVNLSRNCNDFSVSSTEEKGKLSSLKDIDVSPSKKLNITTSEKLPSHLSGNEDCINVRYPILRVKVDRLPSSILKSQNLNKDDILCQKNILSKLKTHSFNSFRANKIDNRRSRELKVVLERLPASTNQNSTNTTMKTEILNKNDIQQKEILDKFETHSSNIRGINKVNNINLREVKIILEQLPSNIYFNDKNSFADENIISKNTNLHNSIQESQIENMSKISPCKNIEMSFETIDKVDNNYSFRIHTKYKKYDNSRISDTSNIVAEHQVFDKIKSKFPSQANQENHSKYTVLISTSSDEDDFVRLIHPKKKRKFSIKNKLLNERNASDKILCNKTEFCATNKTKYDCNRTLRTKIFSLKESKTNKPLKSIKERKGSSKIEIKSFDNTTASLKVHDNKKLLFTTNKNDSDIVTEDVDKGKQQASFPNSNESINNNKEKHSNAVAKRNKIDYEDNSNIFFQTEMFYSDFSDSEGNNSYIVSNCKAFKNSSVRNESQCRNYSSSEEFSNDSIKKYDIRKLSSSSNSSFENRDATNQLPDVKIRLRSTDKRTKIRKRDTFARKEIFSKIFPNKNNISGLSKNKQISDKSNNSTADVKSTKLSLFQTKTYCDSDCEENSYSISNDISSVTLKNSSVRDKTLFHNDPNSKELSNNSTKRYNIRKQLSSINSFEKRDVANEIHDKKIGLTSTGKDAKINKRDTIAQNKVPSNIFRSKNNVSGLSKNKQISNKSNNSAVIQGGDVKSAKSLIFQTKTYYDSDSNESL